MMLTFVTDCIYMLVDGEFKNIYIAFLKNFKNLPFLVN